MHEAIVSCCATPQSQRPVAPQRRHRSCGASGSVPAFFYAGCLGPIASRTSGHHFVVPLDVLPPVSVVPKPGASLVARPAGFHPNGFIRENISDRAGENDLSDALSSGPVPSKIPSINLLPHRTLA